MARPQTHNEWEEKTIEGIDIMLAMDVSTSMLIDDMRYDSGMGIRRLTRIQAALNVASEFISDRSNDNIGLTLFAGEAFTQCPLTIDHSTLLSLLQHAPDYMGTGIIIDKTAIGMGLSVAVSHLDKSKAKSRIIILLTDGSNNYGEIQPLMAAEIARSKGIRVYTIGVGSTDATSAHQLSIGGTMQQLVLPNDLDEETLRKIANATNGKYYRATNASELSQIYSDIDRLEKTKLEVQQYSKVHDVYQQFIIVAIIALLLEILLRITVFRRIP